MDDFVIPAERLFRDFATRHSLKIKKDSEHHIDLLMTIPKQNGLSFELTLGIQNTDEINIGFLGFWSYIFPFDKVRDNVSRQLDGLVTGNTRLVIHKQFERIIQQDLEEYKDGKWTRFYCYKCKIRIPLVQTEISYITNKD